MCGSRYLDQRTAINVMKLSGELSDIAALATGLAWKIGER
jgi:hypothetical protein